MADTTRHQLNAKQGQLVEFNNAMANKIKDEMTLERRF